MKVPTSHYLRFYITNTTLGASFCTFLSVFPSMAITALLYPYSIYFLVVLFLIHQVYIVKSFFEPYRGNFEYTYLGRKITKTVNSKIAKHYGLAKLFGLWFDELGYVGVIRDDFYKAILGNELLMNDEEFEFSFYMRLARIRAKQDDIGIEKEYLQKALKIQPNHPVTLFRLAHNFEKEGNPEEAINYYQNILKVPLADSRNFKAFVSKQIERIKKSGPSRRPPNPGLRFAVMY